MSDIIEHYQLFGFVFFLLLFFSYLVFNTFFDIRDLGISGFEPDETAESEKKIFRFKGIPPMPDYDDQELEYKFQKLFLNPKNGIIIFLKSYNLLRVYHKRELENLYYFYENWNSKSFKFKESEMEKLRDLLYADIKEFLLLLYGSSRETNNGYFQVESNMDRLYQLIDNILSNYNLIDEIIEGNRFEVSDS